jgi:cation transport protein ChaC
VRIRITRDSIQSGAIERLIAAADPALRLMTDAEIKASLAEMLRACPTPGPTWVFGYGSLMWNPAFDFVEHRVGIVHGYHRRFCLWTHLGRGSPDVPGLMLALEPGGACRGVAYRIADDAMPEELEIIWRREMIGGSYRPRWVTVRTAAGPVAAVAFTINRANARYAGRLSEDAVAASIARASGHLGPCSEYLFNTVAHLEELGIHDRSLARLRDRVAADSRALAGDSRVPRKVPTRAEK